jgi:hypothetical protein
MTDPKISTIVCRVSVYITAFIPPITVYIPVNMTMPIAPYQNGIANNSETTIPPA